MRRLLISKRMRVVFLAVVVSLVAATGVAAQDSSPPDLGTGWELRLEQSMDGWSTVAGSAGAGFLVRGWNGDGSAAGEVALWSADGLEWQEITDETGRGPVFDLAANDSGFVAARGDQLPNNSVLFSPDGLTWETINVGGSADFWRLASGPEGFLLMSGCDFVVRFSMDGHDWKPADTPPECGTFTAAQTSDGWVGVTNQADNVAVLSSGDGISWSEVEAQPPLPPLPAPTSWPGYVDSLRNVSLSSDGETLVLAGKGIGGGLWVSMDGGITWTDTGPENGEVEMTVADFGFVGVGPERVVVSSDGVSWVEHRVDVDFHDVAAAGHTVVATAQDGIYTWTAPPASLPETGTNTTPAVLIGVALIATGAAVLAKRRSLADAT